MANDVVTLPLMDWRSGDKEAVDLMWPQVYAELRRLAAAYIRRERSGHTLQTTALVHEAYLRLVDQTRVESQSRTHFIAIAANCMRQILVNHALRRRAAKRGGGNQVALEEAVALIGQPNIDLVALDQALKKLAQLDSRQCQIVELRFFVGLTEEEIAEHMSVSASTVKREWRTAKAMLHHELMYGGLE